MINEEITYIENVSIDDVMPLAREFIDKHIDAFLELVK